MNLRRRNLRKLLIVVGCVLGHVEPGLASIGLALLLVGGALHLWAKGCLEQNRSLTTAGPYRWSRNPFYLANALLDLGLCFVIGQWWIGVGYFALWAYAYRSTIDREEAQLARLFGDEFERYRARVPRLWPIRGPLPLDAASGNFNWNSRNLTQGREYARLFGIALSVAAIVAAETFRTRGIALFGATESRTLGILVLLPCGWIVKLALAEVLRRRTRLIPRSLRGRFVRLCVVSALFGGTLAGAVLIEPTQLPVSLFGSACAVAVAHALATTPPRSAPVSAALDLFLAFLTLGIGLGISDLTLTGLPVLWLSVCALDSATPHPPPEAGAPSAESKWSMASPIVAGALACAASLIALQLGLAA